MFSFDFGQSLFHQGEFLKAAEVLEGFCNSAEKSSPEYSEALFHRLRIYTELELDEKRQILEKELYQNLSTLNQKDMALFNYVQGYNAFIEKQYEESHFLFEKSLQHAVETSCRFTLAQALFGCVFASLALQRDLGNIDHKMSKLEMLSEQLERADLRVSVLSLKTDVALQNKEYQKAIDLAWKAYDQVKFVKNNFLGISIIATLGHVYLVSGDHEKAHLYLTLAYRSIDPTQYKLLARKISRLLKKINVESFSDYDLILDEQKNVLIEKSKGPVELKNQFLLMDLLKLLMLNPGVPFSKEELAKKLWNQKYDPAVHDNTIYVTIKRIRSLIEPNPHHSKYILRSRKGYLLNQDSTVLIHKETHS